MSFQLPVHSPSLTRVLLAATAAAAVAVSASAFAARHHDTRMDDADAALEKAAALVAASDCTTAVARNQRDCEKSLQKTLSHIESARTSLADAMLAADGGTPTAK